MDVHVRMKHSKVELTAYRQEQGGNADSELACFVDLHLQLEGRIQQRLSDSH